MRFEFNKYMDFVTNNKFDIARKYKNDTKPKTVYKYVSLDGSSCLDKKKLSSLIKNQIWFSKFEALNDPFEFKAICQGKIF